MPDYLNYFIDSPDQIVSLVCVGAVWLVFTSLGAAFGGQNRIAAVDPLIGWAAVSLLFTLAGVLFRVPFSLLSGLSVAAALAAGIIVWRRGDHLIQPALVKVLIMTAPLLVLVAAMKGSQWDEFSDWLIIPRYLLSTDAFPSQGNPFPKAVYTGYPYSWHFVTYLASRAAGSLLENAGALTNVLLLFSFGLIAVGLIGRGLEREDLVAKPGWTLAAIGALAATLINPTFVQKVALTSYADTSSAVVTGAGVVLAWYLLEELAAGRSEKAKPLAWQLGAVLLVLINLKQATLVLVVLTVLAALFIAIRDKRISLGGFLRLLPVAVLPALLIYAVWRYHLSNELTVQEFKLRPMADWYIHLIPQILAKMGLILTKKGYYLVLLVILIGFGLRGFWRSETPFDRFAALAAMVVLGYNAFLLFAYVATFGEYDALRAASYWRYSMHIGMVIVAFSAYGAAVLWRKHMVSRQWPTRLGWLPIVLLVAIPFVFTKKLRFDKAPMTVHFRTVGAAVAGLVKSGDGVYVVDPTGSGESGVITSFELGEQAHYRGYVSAFHGDRLKPLKDAVARKDITALVVHSVNDGYSAIIGALPAGQTHFLMRGTESGWRLVKSWPLPSTK